MKNFFLVICFFLLQLTSISAQESPLIFKTISRINGLPVDEITTMAQDSSGFIWVGTPEGLFRYDGFGFKNFSFDGSNNNFSTGITRIVVDNKGRLWIGSNDAGLSCLSPSGKKLKLVNSSTDKLITENANYVTDIRQDREGKTWWATIDGLFCLDESGPRCFRVLSSHVRGNSFNHIDFDPEGHMWVSGFSGLFVFDKNLQQLLPAGMSVGEKAFFGSMKDYACIAFQGNRIWYSNWIPELGVYDRANGSSAITYSGKGSSQPDFNRKANTIFIDSKGSAWIGTGYGLSWIRSNGTIQTFRNEAGNDFSLVNDKINDVMEDREGNFWFATKKGMSMARPYAHAIRNISSQTASAYPFANKEINDVIQVDSNTLLIGTHEADGIYMTDLQFRTIRHWYFNKVAYDWVWRFFDDPQHQRVFIATQEGMLLFDKQTREISKAKDSVLQNFYPITSFVATSDSIVWMTRFWNKLMRYNLNTGEHKIYDFTKMGEKPRVLYLSKDKNNRLWIIAHQSGLWRFDPVTERIVERLEKNESNSSIKESVLFNFLDIGEYYLMGYRTKGISLYHKKSKSFQHFTRETGLVSNTIRDVIALRDGSLWIATQNGLTHYNPSDGEMTNYNYESGILNNDFIRIHELKDGRLVAVSTRGLIAFDPDEMEKKETVAAPMITDIRIYGQNVPTDTVYNSDQPLKIGYGDNYFSFEFISLHYKSPQQVEYAYKLEGLDKDWINAGSRRFVSYNRVPGGYYHFRVRARWPNGKWVEAANPVSVYVATAFYKQWWFYGLAFLLTLAFFYALFRYRLRQALKVERMRTAISGDLHDEVGASLTSISLFSEMARQSKLPEHTKEEYLQRIGERSRESIEKMSDIIWSINPENDHLDQLLLRMKNYALEVSEARDIALQWNQSSKILHLKLSMEQRKDLYLFFKEAVNNAVKHAGAKNLRVNFSVNDSLVHMQISDDGKGFDVNAAFTGNGLKNMQRRAGQLNGEIRIISGQPEGTMVELQFKTK